MGFLEQNNENLKEEMCRLRVFIERKDDSLATQQRQIETLKSQLDSIKEDLGCGLLGGKGASASSLETEQML